MSFVETICEGLSPHARECSWPIFRPDLGQRTVVVFELTGMADEIGHALGIGIDDSFCAETAGFTMGLTQTERIQGRRMPNVVVIE